MYVIIIFLTKFVILNTNEILICGSKYTPVALPQSYQRIQLSWQC